MKPKIIIFLLLLAGVGTKAKAEGNPLGDNPLVSPAITFMNERGEQIVGPVFSKDPLIEGIFQFQNWVSAWVLTCTKVNKNITCPVSLHQEQQIKSGILNVLVVKSLGLPPPILALRGAIIGAIATSAVLGILEVWELMYKVLRSPEDSQRARGTLPMYRCESAVGAWRAHPSFSRNLVKWLLPTMVKVTVAALLGAGVGAIAELLDCSPQPVAVHLGVSGGKLIQP